jgi:hypothetical protein
VQSLSEKDKMRKLAFCENFITQLEEDKALDLFLVFSDETTIHLRGIVNKQNGVFLGE